LKPVVTLLHDSVQLALSSHQLCWSDLICFGVEGSKTLAFHHKTIFHHIV